MTLSVSSNGNSNYVSPFGSEALKRQLQLPISSSNELQSDGFIKRHKKKNGTFNVIGNILLTATVVAGAFLYKKNLINGFGKLKNIIQNNNLANGIYSYVSSGCGKIKNGITSGVTTLKNAKIPQKMYNGLCNIGKKVINTGKKIKNKIKPPRVK